ncbi:MAG: peptide chain release factor N(5)-glutamine methyltransferase [Pseudomonadota bacterium]
MPEPISVQAWLRLAVGKLSAANIPTPELDAKLLLKKAAGLSSSGLIANSRDWVDYDVLCVANQMLERRLSGMPVQRIMGRCEFFGREFSLSDSTLIPRSDTETLIDVVLEKIALEYNVTSILDIGTGSGAIAVTLAAELPDTNLVATDVSADALDTAADNARSHQVKDRIRFALSDLFENVADRFDLIVSNPPYIASAEIEGLQKEVRLHDPYLALHGGDDGLDFYRAMFSGSWNHLHDGALVCVEVGINQHLQVCNIAKEHGFSITGVYQDLTGIERVVVAQKTGVAKIHNKERINVI